MEDYIIREINKIGAIILSIISRYQSSRQEQVAPVQSTCLKIPELDLDVEELLRQSEPVKYLYGRYDFDDENFELFSRLLFEIYMVEESESKREQIVTIITEIYGYIRLKGRYFSLDMHYISHELNIKL